MNTAPDYRRATNKAYELLLLSPSFSMAVDVFAIVWARKDCVLYTYREAVSLYGFTIETLLAVSEYGFTILNKRTNHRIILYNDDMPICCIRFTIAHELGHCVLGHENDDDPNSEKEANCFTRNLLCPISVIEAMEITSPRDYMNAFNVSFEMAEISMKHKNSDRHYISANNSSQMEEIIFAYNMGFDSVDALYRHLYA